MDDLEFRGRDTDRRHGAVLGDAERRTISEAAALPAFEIQWIVMLFVLAIVMAHLHAWARGTSGAGPGTALKIGFLVGFTGGFPMSFAQAAWSPIPRIFPLSWMLEIWVGAIPATRVAGFLYKD